MDEATMYVKLASAVERLKGAGTWTDLRLALHRARDAKVAQALHAILDDFTLDELLLAERLTDKEVFAKQQQPAQPAASMTALKAELMKPHAAPKHQAPGKVVRK
jgi:dihydroorotase-like cyclic amidohydrolase